MAIREEAGLLFGRPFAAGWTPVRAAICCTLDSCSGGHLLHAVLSPIQCCRELCVKCMFLSASWLTFQELVELYEVLTFGRKTVLRFQGTRYIILKIDTVFLLEMLVSISLRSKVVLDAVCFVTFACCAQLFCTDCTSLFNLKVWCCAHLPIDYLRAMVLCPFTYRLFKSYGVVPIYL